MSKRIKKRMEGARTFEDNAALIMGIFTLAVLCLVRWFTIAIILIFWRRNINFTVRWRLVRP